MSGPYGAAGRTPPLGVLQRACGRWRGRPFSAVAVGRSSLVAGELHRCEKLYLQVSEEYAATALRHGRPGDAVPVLRRLTAEFPIRERLYAVAIRCLVGAGDTAAALGLYHQTRTVLAREPDQHRRHHRAGQQRRPCGRAGPAADRRRDRPVPDHHLLGPLRRTAVGPAQPDTGPRRQRAGGRPSRVERVRWPLRLTTFTTAHSAGSGTKYGPCSTTSVVSTTASLTPTPFLRAVDAGVRLYGASRMGALRAAECHPWGMVGVGRVFEAFRTGVVDADDEVAMVYDDRDRPLSEPLIGMRLALADGAAAGLVDPGHAQVFLDAARRVYFPHRTVRSVLRAVGATLDAADRARLAEFPTGRDRDVKRADAYALLRRIRDDWYPALPLAGTVAHDRTDGGERN
ncbi:TfuA-like protein [Solwaraspora sp. WMMA2101]|uniref:TfuA-like protein n=1 Tax=Solwaraspora sp. WMMA2101 TaxID=3404124 RepID=UPI003B965CB4